YSRDGSCDGVDHPNDHGGPRFGCAERVTDLPSSRRGAGTAPATLAAVLSTPSCLTVLSSAAATTFAELSHPVQKIKHSPQRRLRPPFNPLAAWQAADNCDPFGCATGYSDPGRIRAGLRGEPIVWGRCAERHAR